MESTTWNFGTGEARCLRLPSISTRRAETSYPAGARVSDATLIWGSERRLVLVDSPLDEERADRTADRLRGDPLLRMQDGRVNHSRQNSCRLSPQQNDNSAEEMRTGSC
jgi:hypothetical protein